MEAAGAIRALPEQLRSRRFARDCEQLRPLGEAYVLRRFGGSLGRADAEDAVAEVLIRLHRRMAEGRPPDNLRAAFFTSCRNAAIDQLRARSVRPTVALEAAADAPSEAAPPAEWAEGREDAVRLQEALGRMRGNYREAILLRFGLGLTVPEIAEHLQISLPAAKKLVLRATAQVRKRLESIEGREFCPEMRQLAQRALFEKEACGLANEVEAKVLHAHFEHCGSCRSFLANLHDGLHELGGGMLAAGTAGAQLSGKVGIADHLARWAGDAAHGVQAGIAKARFTAFRATGALQPGGDGTAGALAGTGQKIAAICTAGAATTATCLATGIVGPGLGISAPPVHHDPKPARVKKISELASPSAEPVVTEATAEPEPTPVPEPEPAPQSSSESSVSSPAPELPAETPAQQSGAEFGIESTSAPEPAPEPAPAPTPAPSTSSPEGGSTSSAGGSSSGSASGGGSESFGFHG
jgi:RNA polymerase sigma factor (sigma-70 family)